MGCAPVNQNSSVQPVRRYLVTGPNGPAASAMAANTACPVSARSVARAGRQIRRWQTGMRSGVKLSRVRTAPPASAPAPIQAQLTVAASPGRRTAAARPAPNSIALRTMSGQETRCAAGVRHATHPQPPGTRLNRAYPSKAQNAAPAAAMAAPPATG